ncbi:LysR family transcriptional regulator [Pyramidobacter sp. CG50-2]|uniref:LysR family transcriptional regulator n=1 Tax=Pyramidobacter sp. CG50-2 TaxID=2382160 RepID=UPI000EA398FD|nr:LysR family transcriptional regulator [Pyramidobacter sp. CG50-2]RKJ78460.1 LysR family transcriptional regulator [Pyramidobacter sp. CG50-2]
MWYKNSKKGVPIMFRPNNDYFIAIVECGSATKAAEKLLVSQSSLSQYLKRLEEFLGVELFDHHTSPLKLTFAGERYYAYARQAKKAEENIIREFQDIRAEEAGRLKLGLALWRGACLLPDVFPAFHARYPRIQLELMEGSSAVLEKALMNDHITLAVLNVPHNIDYNKLFCEKIFEEPILLAVPNSHPMAQQALADNIPPKGAYPRISINILRRFPVILTKQGQNLTSAVRSALAWNDIEPDILLETANLTTAINLVARGMACAFVPAEGARVCAHPGLVTFFDTGLPDLIWPLSVVYRKDIYLPRIPRLFIQSLKEQLKEPE